MALIGYRTVERKYLGPNNSKRSLTIKEAICKCDFCKKRFYHLASQLRKPDGSINKRIKHCSKECQKKYTEKYGKCSIRNCEKPLHSKGLKLCVSHHYHHRAWGLDKNGESRQPKCISCGKVVQSTKRKFSKKLETQIKEVLVKNKFEKNIIGNKQAKVVLYKKVCDKCYPKYLREKVTKRLGSVCKCCGENELLFLQIDHVRGGGAQERKKFINIGRAMSGYYEYLLTHPSLKKEYQLLCANCNFGRYYNEGICPHNN